MKNTTKRSRVSTVPVFEETVRFFGSQKLPTIWWNEESRRGQRRAIREDAINVRSVLIAAYFQLRSLEAKVAALQGFLNAK